MIIQKQSKIKIPEMIGDCTYLDPDELDKRMLIEKEDESWKMLQESYFKNRLAQAKPAIKINIKIKIEKLLDKLERKNPTKTFK